MVKSLQAPANSWQDKARQLAGAFLSFIFPPICANCGKAGMLFCVECVAKVSWMQEPVCRQCGRLHKGSSSICPTCVSHPLPLQQIRAAVLFVDPMQSMIHKLKYEGMFGLAEPLADLMLKVWPKWETAVDLIIPVPLYHERQKKRGYNQSELLARHFSQKLDLPMSNSLLQRTRQTRPQVGLNISERLQNVQAAFLAESDVAINKHILLIDDVCTTGATLSAAADALLLGGVKSVSAYCLARAT